MITNGGADPGIPQDYPATVHWYRKAAGKRRVWCG